MHPNRRRSCTGAEHHTDQWAVASKPFSLGGASGQLAAALAYFAVKASDDVETRLGVAAIHRVWATGVLAQDAHSGVTLKPVGGSSGSYGGQCFAHKLEAFAAAMSDRVFLCLESDLAQAEKPSGCRALTLDEFDSWLTAHLEGRVIVGLLPHEFPRLLCILFPGAMISSGPDMVTGAWRLPHERHTLARTLLANEPGIRHTQAAPGDEHLGLFRSADAAQRFAECLLRAIPDAAVCLHVDDLCYDGASITGRAVNDVCGCLKAAPARTVHATEPFCAKLSVLPFGHLLPVPPLAGARVYDITPGSGRYPITIRREHSKAAETIARYLTLSRVGFGILAGSFFAFGSVLPGLVAYVVGLLTDVLDGLVARQWNGVTAWGKHWDGIIDMVFNAMSVTGFVLGAVGVWNKPILALWLTLGTAVPVVLSRPLIPPGSRAAKCRSGLIRCVILVCVLPMLSSEQRLSVGIGLVPLLIIAGVYELSVMMKDEAEGRNSGWFGPPPRALERPDQRLLQSIFSKITRARSG